MNPASMFATNEQKVIFIDEVGQFSKTELELISSWANKNNISIIALGDYKQNSAYIMYKIRDMTSALKTHSLLKLQT